MMFTEKELTAYNNIKAPDELRQKITNIQKKSAKKSLYFIGTVAACFIFIITGFLINNNQNSIIINGQKLKNSIVFYDTSTAMAKTVSSVVSVPIEIKASSSTKISVSKGNISIDGSAKANELTISTSEIIWWEFEPTENIEVFEMKIADKKGSQKVTLKYENAKITVTKEKEK